jgi:hypothetical protein
VVIAPVGAAFYDIRRRVELTSQAPHSKAGEQWWRILNEDDGRDLSSYVRDSEIEEASQHLPHLRGSDWRIRNILGAQERYFLFADAAKEAPWFGHPSLSGTYLYAAVLKRTVLAAMRGKDGISLGHVQLDLRSGNLADSSKNTSTRNHLLLEEVNRLDLELFNEDWKLRSDYLCSQHVQLCRSDPATLISELMATTTTTTVVVAKNTAVPLLPLRSTTPKPSQAAKTRPRLPRTTEATKTHSPTETSATTTAADFVLTNDLPVGLLPGGLGLPVNLQTSSPPEDLVLVDHQEEKGAMMPHLEEKPARKVPSAWLSLAFLIVVVSGPIALAVAHRRGLWPQALAGDRPEEEDHRSLSLTFAHPPANP